MASWTERARAALAALALATACGPARAQVAVLDAYQESAGLTNMTTSCLAQAADGVLWICTENGLFRFDGFHIRREPLPGGAGVDTSSVGALVADRSGRLWVATGGGLFLRSEAGAAVRWRAVLQPDGAPLHISGKQRLDVDEHGVLFAMDEAGQAWSLPAVPPGASPLVAKAVVLPPHERFHSAENIGGPLRAVGGDLWFGCGQGLCQWDDGRLRPWGPAQGLPVGSWGSLLLARDGSLWARSNDHLARLAPGAGHFDAVDAPLAKLWPATIALVEDGAGAIVTATDDGVARWDGKAWRQWTPREGLPETAVRALFVDAAGELWIGTSGRGLHRWVGYGLAEHWTPATGLPSPVVWSFARDGGGRLCAATSRGIACLDEAARAFVTVGKTSAAAGQNSLAVDSEGDLWWVDDGRVLSLRAGESKAREAFADPALEYAVQGTDAVYLGGRHGVERLVASRAGPRREPLPAGLPSPPSLLQVINDGSRDWFLAGGMAYRLDQGHWLPLLDEHGAAVRVNRFALFTGPSELWADDPTGIAVYTVAGGIARLARHIDAALLGGASPLYALADREHRVWVGTDRGVFILAGGRWLRLDRDSGLLWNDVDGNAIYLDRDGAVWIGTSAGATRVLPAQLRAVSPTLGLEEIRFGDRTLRAGPDQPVPWADRHVRLTLKTPDIGRGRSMQLEYRLHLRDPWRAFEGNVLQLESLEADSYRLQVRVAARLPVDEPGSALEIFFTIDPPWWKSTAARLASILALVTLWLLSIQLLRARARATRRELQRAIAQRTAELERSREDVRMLGVHNARSLEEERKRVARELHDEMGQQLAALRMEVSVLRMHARAGRAPEDGALGMLLERVDGLVAGMRSVVAQLRPPALDGGLAPALEWLAAEFTRHTGVPCRLELDACARTLHSEAATMVFRIAQESLNNVRRHAGATQVALQLRQDGGDCELRVADDGSGFDARGDHAGYGVLGMEERARALGGKLEIESRAGTGTTVRLRVRLAAEEG